MTSTVATILNSIAALSVPEQQELMLALCDRVTLEAPLELSLGADSAFVALDTTGKRELLRQKLLSGLEQIKQGRVTDGEIVFDRRR
jgi:hypothetical protein